MEGKKVTKISVSTFCLICAVIVIIVMSIFIYKFYNEKIKASQKSAELQIQVNSLNTTVNDLQGKINNISKTIQSNNLTENKVTTNDLPGNTNLDSVKDENTTYTISVRDEIYATIKANKEGKTIEKEFEMSGTIDKTETMNIENIGEVALISDSGGEYTGVHIYKLVNNEIKLLGEIDCGADMIKETTYTVDTKNEGTVVINAQVNGETTTNEFEMSAAIDNTSIIDIFDYGKVVLVAESGGEYYGVQVYRLSQDDNTGKNKKIKNVGSIQEIYN